MKHANTQKFYVYAHYRKTTGEIFYIGKGNGRRAWSGKRANRYWHHIATKDGFDVRIIKDGLSEVCALTLETALIFIHGRYPNGPLVNMTDGGEGTSGWEPSVEWKKNRSACAKKAWENGHGKIVLERSKASWTDERRKKFSEEAKKRFENEEYKKNRLARASATLRKKGKRIVCITDGKEFSCLVELCEFYGFKHGDVRRVLHGEQRAVRGKIFKYFGEIDPVWGGRTYYKGNIYCVELNRWFNSAKEAADELNLSTGNVSNVLKKKAKKTKGFSFLTEKDANQYLPSGA